MYADIFLIPELKCEREVSLVILRVPQLLKAKCKTQNKSILESGIPLQKAFKVDEVQHIFHSIY